MNNYQKVLMILFVLMLAILLSAAAGSQRIKLYTGDILPVLKR